MKRAQAQNAANAGSTAVKIVDGQVRIWSKALVPTFGFPQYPGRAASDIRGRVRPDACPNGSAGITRLSKVTDSQFGR
jgi:hypothetical protein